MQIKSEATIISHFYMTFRKEKKISNTKTRYVIGDVSGPLLLTCIYHYNNKLTLGTVSE